MYGKPGGCKSHFIEMTHLRWFKAEGHVRFLTHLATQIAAECGVARYDKKIKTCHRGRIHNDNAGMFDDVLCIILILMVRF